MSSSSSSSVADPLPIIEINMGELNKILSTTYDNPGAQVVITQEELDNLYSQDFQDTLCSTINDGINSIITSRFPPSTVLNDNVRRTEQLKIILALSDTIHDFWKGRGKHITSGHVTELHGILQILFKEYLNGFGVKEGCTHSDMNVIINRCLKCQLPEYEISTSEIEHTTMAFFEKVSTLNKLINKREYTYTQIIALDIAAEKEKLLIDNVDTITITDDGSFNNYINDDTHRNKIREFIKIFFGKTDLYLSYDANQATINKIFSGSDRDCHLFTPQNMADSATTSTADQYGTKANTYYFPQSNPLDILADGSKILKTNSNYFTHLNYDIIYKNNEFDETTKSYGFTIIIKNKDEPWITAPNGTKNYIELKYTRDDGISLNGPSVNYLYKYIRGEAPTNPGNIVSLYEEIKKAPGLVGTNPPSPFLQYLLLDLKRGGDYDQIEAVKLFNNQNSTKDQGILVTLDGLCSLKSRVSRVNTILTYNKKLTLYKMVAPDSEPVRIIKELLYKIPDIKILLKLLPDPDITSLMQSFSKSIKTNLNYNGLDQKSNLFKNLLFIKRDDMNNYLTNLIQLITYIRTINNTEFATLEKPTQDAIIALYTQISQGNNVVIPSELLKIINSNPFIFLNFGLVLISARTNGLTDSTFIKNFAESAEFTQDLFNIFKKTLLIINQIFLYFENNGYTYSNIKSVITFFGQAANLSPFDRGGSYLFLKYNYNEFEDVEDSFTKLNTPTHTPSPYIVVVNAVNKWKQKNNDTPINLSDLINNYNDSLSIIQDSLLNKNTSEKISEFKFKAYDENDTYSDTDEIYNKILSYIFDIENKNTISEYSKLYSNYAGAQDKIKRDYVMKLCPDLNFSDEYINAFITDLITNIKNLNIYSDHNNTNVTQTQGSKGAQKGVLQDKYVSNIVDPNFLPSTKSAKLVIGPKKNLDIITGELKPKMITFMETILLSNPNPNVQKYTDLETKLKHIISSAFTFNTEEYNTTEIPVDFWDGVEYNFGEPKKIGQSKPRIKLSNHLSTAYTKQFYKKMIPLPPKTLEQYAASQYGFSTKITVNLGEYHPENEPIKYYGNATERVHYNVIAVYLRNKFGYVDKQISMIQDLDNITVQLGILLLSINRLSVAGAPHITEFKKKIQDGHDELKKIQRKLMCNLLTYYDIVLKLQGDDDINLKPNIIKNDIGEIRRYTSISYFACNLFEEYLGKSSQPALDKKKDRDVFYNGIVSSDQIETIIQNYYIFLQQEFIGKFELLYTPISFQSGGLQLLNDKKSPKLLQSGGYNDNLDIDRDYDITDNINSKIIYQFNRLCTEAAEILNSQCYLYNYSCIIIEYKLLQDIAVNFGDPSTIRNVYEKILYIIELIRKVDDISTKFNETYPDLRDYTNKDIDPREYYKDPNILITNFMTNTMDFPSILYQDESLMYETTKSVYDDLNTPTIVDITKKWYRKLNILLNKINTFMGMTPSSIQKIFYSKEYYNEKFDKQREIIEYTTTLKYIKEYIICKKMSQKELLFHMAFLNELQSRKIETNRSIIQILFYKSIRIEIVSNPTSIKRENRQIKPGIDANKARRRREEYGINLRREKRGEEIQKRRSRTLQQLGGGGDNELSGDIQNNKKLLDEKISEEEQEEEQELEEDNNTVTVITMNKLLPYSNNLKQLYEILEILDNSPDSEEIRNMILYVSNISKTGKEVENGKIAEPEKPKQEITPNKLATNELGLNKSNVIAANVGKRVPLRMTLKFKPKIKKSEFNKLVENKLSNIGITDKASPIVKGIENQLLEQYRIIDYTPLPQGYLNERKQFATTGQATGSVRTRGGKIKTRSHKPKPKRVTKKKGGLTEKEKKPTKQKKKSFSRTLYKVNRFLKNKTQSKK
jgi:hypothetical protein